MTGRPVDPHGTGPHLTFRSRAVRVAGVVDLVVGVVLVAGGVAVALPAHRLPVGLAVGVLGVLLALSGLSRTTARMELTRTRVTWYWSFSWSHLDLADLDDAALVEKGAPASGAAWVGFLGGGLLMVLFWWWFDLVHGFLSSEPSLGPVELVAIRHIGGPVAITPIGTWSTRASHTEATEALRALQAAIAASGHQPAVTPDILTTDEWERRRPG